MLAYANHKVKGTYVRTHANLSTMQPTSQQAHTPTNALANQPTSQPANQPVEAANMQTKAHTDQPINYVPKRTTGQRPGQSANQPTDRPTNQPQPGRRSVNQPCVRT